MPTEQDPPTSAPIIPPSDAPKLDNCPECNSQDVGIRAVLKSNGELEAYTARCVMCGYGIPGEKSIVLAGMAWNALLRMAPDEPVVSPAVLEPPPSEKVEDQTDYYTVKPSACACQGTELNVFEHHERGNIASITCTSCGRTVNAEKGPMMYAAWNAMVEEELKTLAVAPKATVRSDAPVIAQPSAPAGVGQPEFIKAVEDMTGLTLELPAAMGAALQVIQNHRNTMHQLQAELQTKDNLMTRIAKLQIEAGRQVYELLGGTETLAKSEESA
ncbi:MAG: hypothetical protein IH991_20175 [Planctomycetes bacterium]|nr:hypothetical protein [Planctomycetota bacterium]